MQDKERRMRWVVGLSMAGFVGVGVLWPQVLFWLNLGLRVGLPPAVVVLAAARAAWEGR